MSLKASWLPVPYVSSSFSYDAAGNRTSQSVNGVFTQSIAKLSYNYNAKNQMTSYNGPMGGSPLSVAGTPGLSSLADTAPSVSSSYTYGPSGLLSKAGATSLTWNTASSLPEAIGVNGYSYLYAGGLPIEQIAPDGGVLYYLHNLQGSTVALTGRAGTLEATYSYSPYGSVTRSCVRTALFHSNFSYMDCTSGLFNEPPQALSEGNFLYLFTGFSGLARNGTAGVQAGANHFLYCGQYRDSASGLYYLRARWYDPATGQFLSVDPLVALTGQPYSYAGNDPVNGGDPLGLFYVNQWTLNVLEKLGYSQSTITSNGQFVNKKLPCIQGCPQWVYHPVYLYLTWLLKQASTPPKRGDGLYWAYRQGGWNLYWTAATQVAMDIEASNVYPKWSFCQWESHNGIADYVRGGNISVNNIPWYNIPGSTMKYFLYSLQARLSSYAVNIADALSYADLAEPIIEAIE